MTKHQANTLELLKSLRQKIINIKEKFHFRQFENQSTAWTLYSI